MKHIEEDFERLSKIDKMYLIEAERQMIEDWQQWTEYQEQLPAQIELVKNKKYEQSNKRVRKSF